MKLNINAKKIISTLIAGGIVFNATTIEAKAPTYEDKIAMIIADIFNEVVYKKNVVNDDNVDVYFNKEANCVTYAIDVGPNLSEFLTREERLQIVNQYIYEDVYRLIGAPNIDKISFGYKPRYEVRHKIDNNNSIYEQTFVSDYEYMYFDPAAEEYFNEKYSASKVKQK